jgi:uncharacterized membrane protein
VKVFVIAAMAGLLGLRFSPWFWSTATTHQRADLIVAVLVASALLSGTVRLVRPRKRQRRQRQQQATPGYTYPADRY